MSCGGSKGGVRRGGSGSSGGKGALAEPGDRATVTVAVDVSQDAAFEIFTREIDLWCFQHGPQDQANRRQVRGGADVCRSEVIAQKIAAAAAPRAVTRHRGQSSTSWRASE